MFCAPRHSHVGLTAMNTSILYGEIDAEGVTTIGRNATDCPIGSTNETLTVLCIDYLDVL